VRSITVFSPALALLAAAAIPAAGSEIDVYPSTPALTDTAGSVAGNTAQFAPGFNSGSWQATGVKSNFYVTPLALFGHDVLVSDVASMSYWTDQFNYSGSSNWSLYIYTLNSGAGDSSFWYRSKLFASPGAGLAGWDLWSTTSTALGFVDTDRGGGAASSSLRWSSIAAGTVTLNNGSHWNYSGEKVEFFSLQTDSKARTFTGLVDGLTVNLTTGESGAVNFEAVPEPGTWTLLTAALGLAAVVGRKRRRI